MKSHQLFSLFLIALFSLFSCKNEVFKNETVNLIAPGENEVIHYYITDFEWESDAPNTEFRLVISEDAAFTNVIVDSVLSQTSFKLYRRLIPGADYFWKVEDGVSEAQSQFSIIDYLECYKGGYEAKVTISNWVGGTGVIKDTTFTGYMTITKLSKTSVRVREEKTNSTVQYKFQPALGVDENEVAFLFDNFSKSAYCIFNYVTDSIYASKSDGGHGWGTIYSFRAKKE